jgi:hypothetical protein
MLLDFSPQMLELSHSVYENDKTKASTEWRSRYGLRRVYNRDVG